MLAMLYRMRMSAEKHWCQILGFSYLAEVVEGVVFTDGVEVDGNK